MVVDGDGGFVQGPLRFHSFLDRDAGWRPCRQQAMDEEHTSTAGWVSIVLDPWLSIRRGARSSALVLYNCSTFRNCRYVLATVAVSMQWTVMSWSCPRIPLQRGHP